MSARAGFLTRRLLSSALRPLPVSYRAFHGSIRWQQVAAEVESRPNSEAATDSRWKKRDKALEFVEVTIDEQAHSLPTLFLRDACTCPKCVDPSTQQKHFQTSDIPPNIGAQVQPPTADGPLRISWTNDHPSTAGDDHISEYSAAWLRETIAKQIRLSSQRAPLRERVTWDRERLARDNLWVDYKDYAFSDQVLLRALRHLQTHGLVFLKNVPDDETSVIKIAERIGPLRDSFYGRTWDVRSVPDAKNVAYTNQYLGLHMDLLYMTNPPHLQFLHSLRAKAQGGESLFSDSFHAAEIMRQEHSRLFHVLTQQPVTYHYHNASQHYEATRRTIELELRGVVGAQGGVATRWSTFNLDRPGISPAAPHKSSAVARINWSPPFQGPFQMNLGRLASYHDAARTFSKLVNAEENVFEYRMAEGECMIFDNRRVLHARKAFDVTGGERWLKGAYVDDDAYWSRLRVLEETIGQSPA